MEEKTIQQALVKFTFSAKYEDEIDLKFNDVVTIMEDDIGVEGWCKILHGDKEGLVPKNYLSIFHPILLSGITAIANYPFKHNDHSGQFLEFSRNEKIKVLSRHHSGWSKAFYNNHIGLFPDFYVTYSLSASYDDLHEVFLK